MKNKLLIASTPNAMRRACSFVAVTTSDLTRYCTQKGYRDTYIERHSDGSVSFLPTLKPIPEVPKTKTRSRPIGKTWIENGMVMGFAEEYTVEDGDEKKNHDPFIKIRR